MPENARVTISILDPSSRLQEELVAEVPKNITAKGLTASLIQQGILQQSPEASFVVDRRFPAERRLGGEDLQDGDTITIQQMLPGVKILERKKP
jgi:hypothetical protein